MELNCSIQSTWDSSRIISHREGAPCTIYGFNHAIGFMYLHYILIAVVKMLEKKNYSSHLYVNVWVKDSFSYKQLEFDYIGLKQRLIHLTLVATFSLVNHWELIVNCSKPRTKNYLYNPRWLKKPYIFVN